MPPLISAAVRGRTVHPMRSPSTFSSLLFVTVCDGSLPTPADSGESSLGLLRFVCFHAFATYISKSPILQQRYFKLCGGYRRANHQSHATAAWSHCFRNFIVQITSSRNLCGIGG